MRDIEKAALDLYLEAANIYNEFKPMSFEKISEALKDQGFEKVNKSTIKRWADRFNFKEHLDVQIATALTENKNEIQLVAIDEQLVKKTVDIKRNNELTADCYDLLEEYVDQVKDKKLKHGAITADDIKIVKDIAAFTGGREDKLLDRLAGANPDRVSSDDVLKQIAATDVELEEEIDE